ncbi:hypothetical protein AB0J86_29245 [Micromonospora sp. NPDC049559]|uniref:hypothetical protein n=1 Tax=Micromonospora sp. NPDC049559 TaxID=3155923 RepID=UPI003426001B
MLIDCDSCTVRGAACAGCMMNALVTEPPRTPQRDGPGHDTRLTGAELRAIETFARAGFDVEVLGQSGGPALRPARRPHRRHHVA